MFRMLRGSRNAASWPHRRAARPPTVLQSSTRFCASAAGLGTTPCPFKTLGVPRTATKEEVKLRYKDLAKTHHPDCGGTEARFKTIQAAYEGCLEAIAEDEVERAHGTAASSSNTRCAAGGDGHEFRGDWEFKHTRYAHADGFNETRTRSPEERRERLCDMFASARTADALDDLLVHSLQSGVFDTIDIGEPVLRAISRYHLVGIPVGSEHTARCFAAIDRWEHWHRRTAPQSYYYPVLTVYSEAAQSPGFDTTAVTEGAAAVLEQIQSKGMNPDDWCQSLASIVFNYFPKNWG